MIYILKGFKPIIERGERVMDRQKNQFTSPALNAFIVLFIE